MNLTRINLTGNLDLNTPKPVLLEIAKSSKFGLLEDRLDYDEYRNKVIEKLNNYQNYVQVDDILAGTVDKNEVKKLARYINPEVEWNLSSLKNAYLILSNHDPKIIPVELSFGNQTPDNLSSLSYSIVYRICRYYQIKTKYTDKVFELQNHIRILSRTESLRNYILATEWEVEELRRIYAQKSTVNITKKEISTDLLNIAFNTYKNIEKKILQKINKSTLEESIVFTILIYDLDISATKNPKLEYYNLNLNFYHENFHFLDSDFDQIYQLNKRIFKFSQNFNPIFPNSFYSSSKIEQFYEAEIDTFPNDHIVTSSYQELQTLSLINNWYHGFHLGIKNQTLEVYLADVFDQKNDDIICYGVKNQDMKAYTYDEIAEIFENNMAFILAQNQPVEIGKLLKLSVRHKKERMVRAISDIKLFNDSKGKIMRELPLYYQNNPEKQGLIRDIIRKLLELGMYMRGWLGINDFPVKVAMADDELIVCINSSHALAKFEEICKELGKDAYIILNFPLLKYNKCFQYSVNPEDGITLQDRLKIIREGESTKNMSSCIRLSSNYICTTAHKMYTILKLKEPFEIQNLRNIS